MATKILTLPPTHSPKQKLIGNFYRTPNTSDLWVACGTKFGKTLASSFCLASIFPTRAHRGRRSRWVAPIYTQTMIGFRYMRKMLPPAPDVESTEGKPAYIFMGGDKDTAIEFLHGQNPEILEGEGPFKYVIDEAAKQKEAVYHSIKTTRTATKAQALWVSTPLGKNWFHERAMEAKAQMKWALKHGKIPKQLFITARTIDNPYIDKEQVEEARRTLPDRLFRQYYLAEFVSESNVFGNFRECLFPLVLPDWDKNERQRWVSENAHDRKVIIGADWAKVRDFTVFIALDVQTGRIVGFDRFRGLSYPEAIKQLSIFAGEYEETVNVRHDATGVGMAIEDLLNHLSLPNEPFVFTNEKKNYAVNSTIMAIQEKQIAIPMWRQLISELDSFEVAVTVTGRMSYNGVGENDDTVSALILAVSSYLEYKGVDFSELGSFEEFDKMLKSIESDSMEDDGTMFDRLTGVIK